MEGRSPLVKKSLPLSEFTIFTAALSLLAAETETEQREKKRHLIDVYVQVNDKDADNSL